MGPKWLLPAALAAGVLALVYTQREAPIQNGDVVLVKVADLGAATQQTLPPTVLNNSVLAFQVRDASQAGSLSADLVGFQDAQGVVQRFPAPVGIGPFAVPRNVAKRAPK